MKLQENQLWQRYLKVRMHVPRYVVATEGVQSRIYGEKSEMLVQLYLYIRIAYMNFPAIGFQKAVEVP